MNRGMPLAVAVCILVSGCLGVSLPSARTTSPSPVAEQCNIESLSFAERGGRGWASNRVRVNFTLIGTADLFLVVLEQDAVLGTRHVVSDSPRTGSWVPIELDEPLSGIHRIRVLAYGDLDRDDDFDKVADHICEARFGAIQTKVITRNFTEFGTTVPTRSLFPGPDGSSTDGGAA